MRTTHLPRVLSGLLSLAAALLAIATLAEALANRRLYSLVLLPSYERLLEATWLALGFALLALLWGILAELARKSS